MHPRVKASMFSLIDLLNMGFLAVLIGFLITTHDYNPYTDKLYALYGIVLIFIVALAYFRNINKHIKYNLFYLLSAVVIFIVLYESISGLLPIFVGDIRYDAWIDSLDKQVFGISPTVWMQRLIFPLLTEVLYLLYFIYFLMPVILIILLYRNKEYREVEVSLFTLFINYYGAYIAYFFVPVEGPRYYLANEHTVSLDGLLLAEPLRDFINKCEPSTLDCFPSLHTSILIVITFLASRYYRKIFKSYVVLSIIIIFSLVYLRYHYILDILAGAIWALISVYLGTYLYEKYSSRFNSHLVDEAL